MTTTLGLTCASLLSLPPAQWREAAHLASEYGYTSLWTAETTGAEAFSTLAALAPDAPAMGLGTGVIAIQLRTPQLAAMGAATLQALHPDREIFLGVGISSPTVVARWHGAEFGDRPIGQIKAYLDIVTTALRGDPIAADNDFYSIRGSRLGLSLEARRPQIVLGALNPQMLRLAGERADGVLLNYLPSASVAEAVAHVRDGEATAGRETGACTIHAYVHAAVTDLDRARRSAQRDLFSYAVVPAYGRAFSAAGFGAEVEAITAAHAERDRDVAVAAVSDEMIQAIDFCGTAAEVWAFVAAYRAAGVDNPILMPMPWGDDRPAVVAATIRAAR